MNQAQITVENGAIRVVGPYSDKNNTQWRSLGGKFSDGGWTLPDNSTTRQVVADLFGERSEDVEVLIPWEHSGVHGSQILQIGGYVLASRRGRDYRVVMPAGVSLAAGRFSASGGSVKNPRVAGDNSIVFRATVRSKFAESNGLQPVQTIPEAEKIAV